MIYIYKKVALKEKSHAKLYNKGTLEGQLYTVGALLMSLYAKGQTNVNEVMEAGAAMTKTGHLNKMAIEH